MKMLRVALATLAVAGPLAQARFSCVKELRYMPAVFLSLIALAPQFSAAETASSTHGYVRKLFPTDGVIVGWVFDTHAPTRPVTVNFYMNAPGDAGGVLAGSVPARSINKQVNWDFNVDGDHGFSFRIPDKWRDGARHTLYVQPVASDGKLDAPIGGAGGYSFVLPVSSKGRVKPVTDTHCLDANSRCPSLGNDYLAPNYPAASGWSDGKNYFEEWSCTSPAGLDTIARLNIIPLGTFGPHIQKDSLASNWHYDTYDGDKPIIYFTLMTGDHSSRWSLKKAVYSEADKRWNVYSVLDNPESQFGVSSQDGRGKYIIMNDYSLPGWGPSSPIPGSQNKIPGVSNVSAGTRMPSYPLVGAGPLGITAITNTAYPSTRSGGPEGRTCIHANPKLLDYDAQSRPHTLITNMWQNSPRNACPLPPGAPLSRLPAPGNYLYRYEGPELGWQLDLDTGVVTDSLHYDITNKMNSTPKLLAGTAHSLVRATWDGIIETIDLDMPKTNNADMLLDCRKGGVHFGEPTGRKEGIFFLAAKSDIAGERRKYGLGTDVFPFDIYYAYKRK